ncbi:hypothetical protein SAOR_03395 [Salinisphaera orenii MK-B5]|uniref:DUF4393 domain-containing protein n=1 Tax=Salinisphaera orenii MK-B5 TaxID=856730 RepID=A0A423PV77_9GAMM|nr:hypothetical protein [Salinisphaera orenii]ROO29508.1 hypothetical protein SAOR_03395 [Salinisphaera orenii MK-B5]
MATRKNLRPRTPRPLQMLRQAARAAEEWPVTGSAVRRFHDAESWALTELKQRLDAMEAGATDRARVARDHPELSEPAEMMADLLAASRSVDPDAARIQLYRQTLSRLVPDQVAMLALLAEREIAPLCHVAAGRLPAGPVSVNVLTNASSLGRDAGVLLREYVPQYMTELLALGVFQIGPEDERLSDQYELLLADTQIRRTMDHVRRELKLYPRLQRQSVRLSAYGLALWQDCRPTPPAREEGTPAVR